MGKALKINDFYKIKDGILKGFLGILVAYDAIENKAKIKIESNVFIVTNSENLEGIE